MQNGKIEIIVFCQVYFIDEIVLHNIWQETKNSMDQGGSWQRQTKSKSRYHSQKLEEEANVKEKPLCSFMDNIILEIRWINDG